MAFSTFCACGMRSEERGTGEGGSAFYLTDVCRHHSSEDETGTSACLPSSEKICNFFSPFPPPPPLLLPVPPPPPQKKKEEEEGEISRAQMQKETKELSELRDITRYVGVRQFLSSRLPVSVAQISCCDATLKAFQIRHRTQAIANTIDKYSSPFHGRVPSIKANG